MDIFVGNLSFDATQEGVRKLFSDFGKVTLVTILMRKERKVPKSRGFGFVQMPDEQQALAAIVALNGKEFMGRALNVSQARPKKEPQIIDKPGTYRGGRRSRNYMKRQLSVGAQVDAKPRPSSQDNPMRWRKKKSWPKPWQKSPGEHRSWKKAEEGARPWKKAEGESKPWRKSEGGIKPWKKPAGDAKPWSKSNGRTQKSRFKGRKNPGGYKR
jgi:RNA recognition motif-containing protein